MYSLSSVQKKKVTDMLSLINNTKQEKIVTDLLKRNNWDVNSAVEEYYSSGLADKSPTLTKQTSQNIQKIFAHYADPKTKIIEIAGLERFFSDLGLDAANPVTILISKYMNAQTMGFYTWEEFKTGFHNLSCNSVDDLKKKLPQLEQELKDPAKFKDFFKYVFDFAKEPGFKNLSTETAVSLWELLLSSRCKFLQDWIEFMSIEKKDMLVIPKDTWTMLYELIQQTNGDFRNYVDDGAWPSIVDQFSEFYNKKHGSG